MKPVRTKSIILLIAFAFILISSESLLAETWEKTAKSYFEDDYYENCIKVVKKHKDDNFARMFLAFSHLQEYTFDDKKYDKVQYKNNMIFLKAKTGRKDIGNLHYFVNQNDKPRVVKKARKLLKAAFKNCTEDEDVVTLWPVLHSTDRQSREMALKAIKKIIKPKRKVVKKGGTLREKDITMMSNSDLIKALLGNIDDYSAASKILVMIEKPALEYIPQYDGKKVVKLETKITKVINKRERKYPESSWYSATGKK